MFSEHFKVTDANLKQPDLNAEGAKVNEFLGGSRGIVPRKIFEIGPSERPFPAFPGRESG